MRQSAAEVLIGLVVCFGAAEVLLAPARRELREAQASIASVVPVTSGSKAPGADEVARLVRANESGRREIQVRSDASKDEAALFAEIMAIADRYRIRVDQFQPSGTGSSREPLRTDSDAPTGRSGADIVATYSVSLSGGFAGVTRFLDDLRRSSVFIHSRSVRVAPADADPANGVRAELALDVFGFNVAADPADPASESEVTP